MSFYLARLEALRQQQRMTAAAAAGHAALPPRPQHPPLHAGGMDTWRGGGGGVARPVGAPLSAGGLLGVGARGGMVAGSATGGGGGGDELRNKRPLAPTPPPRCPPPKRRAVAASRLFPPGCGRDAALPLGIGSADGDASRFVAARGDGASGAPHKSAPPAAALAGAKDSVLFEAAASSSPSSRAPAPAAGSSWLKKLSASDGATGATTDGGRHRSSENLGSNGVVAAAGALVDADGNLLKCKDCFVPPMRLLPKPTTASASRRFPPGCRRLGAPLPAGQGTNQAVCLPSPEEMVPAEAEQDDMEIVVRPGIGVADRAEQNEVLRDGGTTPGVQESQVSSCSVSLHEAAASGNRWHCEEKRFSTVPATATDANVTDKHGGSSCNVVAESLSQGLSKECRRSDSVSECAALDTTSSNFARGGAPGEGAVPVMRKKLMHTPRKSVKPPRLIQKSVPNTQHRPFSNETEREAELGWNVTMDAIEETGELTKDGAFQEPMSANKCPLTKGKEAPFVGPKKRVNKKKLNKRRVTVKGPAHRPACSLGSLEKLDDKEASILEDDEIFKALAVHETKFQYGPQSADARSRVKIICSRFESICRAIVQVAGHRSIKVRRIDLAADKLIRKLPGFTKQGPIVGKVPGVEVGDEFLYRVQLALVGLHRPYQGGIDATRHETSMLIAISVVASGGYPDELSCSGELIYTGSGKKDGGDQKLEHGNLALKNCIEMKTPVRVIYGFKYQNRAERSHSRAKEISTFTYDGLYHVVDCWREGSPGYKVFKYKLQRIPGQPELSLHMHC